MNVGAIRAAIKTVLEPLNVQIYAFIPDSPNVPAIVIYPRPFGFGMEDDSGNIQFMLLCLAAMTNAEAAQQTLDGWISDEGTASISELFEQNASLGGVVSDASIIRMDAYRAVTLGPDNIRYLSADLILDVFT